MIDVHSAGEARSLAHHLDEIRSRAADLTDVEASALYTMHPGCRGYATADAAVDALYLALDALAEAAAQLRAAGNL